MNRKIQHRELRFEQCEPRHLLATVIGPVQAEYSVETDSVLETGTVDGQELLPSASALSLDEQSAANLREIAIGILNYESATRRIPAHAIYDLATDEPLLSWRVSLLPYLGHHELYDQFDRAEAWDSPHNLGLLASMPDVFRSPHDLPPIPNTGPISDMPDPFDPPPIPNTGPVTEMMDQINPPSELRTGPTNNTVYQVMLGEGTVFPERDRANIRVGQIRDGLSHTILVVEANVSQAVPWTKPADIQFDPADPLNGLVTDTSFGFQAVLANAETLTVPSSIDTQLWTNLVLRDDGQFVDLNQLLPPSEPADAIGSLALGMLNYESAYGRLPAQAIVSDSGQPLLSWRVRVLPFIEQWALYEMFHLDEPWDSEHNLSLLPMMPRIFRHDAVPVGMTNYQVIAGEGTVFPEGSGVRIGHIRDGASNTLLLAEADADRAVEWTRPADLSFEPLDPLNGLGNISEAGFHAVSVDGEVFEIPSSVDPQLWSNFVLRDDGNFVDLSQWAQPLVPSVALRSLGLAALNYESAFNRLPPSSITLADGAPLLSWRVAILPFLEQQSLYERFHLDEPWDSEHNLSLLPMMPRAFWHADVPNGMTNFLAFVGADTAFPATGDGVSLGAIRDGLSNTILFAEADPSAAAEWTRPVDINFSPNDPLNGVGNIRDDSFHVVYADSSVDELSNSISPDEFRQLVIINDSVAPLYFSKDQGIERSEEHAHAADLALLSRTNVTQRATYELSNQIQARRVDRIGRARSSSRAFDLVYASTDEREWFASDDELETAVRTAWNYQS